MLLQDPTGDNGRGVGGLTTSAKSSERWCRRSPQYETEKVLLQSQQTRSLFHQITPIHLPTHPTCVLYMQIMYIFTFLAVLERASAKNSCSPFMEVHNALQLHVWSILVTLRLLQVR